MNSFLIDLIRINQVFHKLLPSSIFKDEGTNSNYLNSALAQKLFLLVRMLYKDCY